jgi:membrane fusion protein YbhG
MTSLLRRLAGVVVLLALLGGFYYLGNKYLWPAPDTNRIDTVGLVEAPEVNITSRIPGRIYELNLLEGDSVERGQIVCRIEDVDIRNQLAKAEGDLAVADADYRNAVITMDRYRKLFAEHVVSAKERDDQLAIFERDRAATVAARATVQYYRDQLKDTEIRSPISGVIVSKNLEVGEWVTPGTPILTVDDLSTVWARVNLEETDLGWIRIGEAALVKLPTRPPSVFEGRVMAIGQEGQYATERDVRRGRQDIRTFYVKVRILQAGGEVKPGMTAEVTFSRRGDAIRASGSNPGARAD